MAKDKPKAGARKIKRQPRRPSPPPPTRAGRPTKLTPAVQEALVDLLKKGVTRQAAAAAVGIGYATLTEWVARGERRDPDRRTGEDFAEFAAVLRGAEAEFEALTIARLQEYAAAGANPDWRAQAWLLERRFSEQWGNRGKQEVNQRVSGPDGKPLSAVVGVVVLPPEDPPEEHGQDG